MFIVRHKHTFTQQRNVTLAIIILKSKTKQQQQKLHWTKFASIKKMVVSVIHFYLGGKWWLQITSVHHWVDFIDHKI